MPDRREAAEHPLQALLHVHVFGPMSGDQEVFPGLQPHCTQNIEPLLRDLQVLVDGVDHRVAGDDDFRVVDPLQKEVLPGGLGGGEEVVGDVVGDDPVDLLGHRAIEASQAGLHMADPDMQLRGGERPGEDRVRVALDEDDIGPLLHQDLLDAGHDPAGLVGMGARADVEVVLRVGEFEFLEEGPVHLVRVVLAGVEDEVINPLCLACPDDRRHLDDLRPGAEDDRDHATTSRRAPVLLMI